MKFKDWCYKYLYDYKSITLKQSTFDSYLRYAKHITTEAELEEINLEELQAVITAMHNKGLKYSTIKHTLTIMRQALNKAYMLHKVNRILPFDLLEVPPAIREPVQALTEDEVRKLLTGTRCTYKDLFLFLLFTGCRVGEAIALTWNDVDLKNGLIYFRYTDYRGQLQSAKNKRSRVIPMTRSVKELLQRHLSFNKKERVFLNKNNKPCIYYTVRDAWTTYASKLQLRPCGLHTLRHTFATLAIRAGANIKAVSQILGHSDVNITLNIYTDISPAQKRIALNTFESALDTSPEQLRIAL